MKLETFFAKFDQFADAPNSIDELRKLILSTAVTGRLVPQDADDEPVEVMLRRIKSTAISKFNDPEIVDTDKVPFAIAKSWKWVRLARVLTKLTDGTHHSPPNGATGDFKYVTAKNIKSEGVLLDNVTYVSREVHEEIYSRCNPALGDVLYIKDGATTGIATINQLAEPFSMLSSVALLKPSAALLNRYLVWAMRSPFFYEETRGTMKGAAITRVNLSMIGASLIPLPPFAEQRRIVAKVDELMALCDRLEAQQAERETRHFALARASLARFSKAPTPANLNFIFHKSYDIAPADLRKSILTLAVQGKLVPQDSNDEAVEDSYRAARQKARLPVRALGTIDCAEIPFEAPKSWRWVTVADVAEARLGKMLDKEKNRGEAHAYLRNTNVHWFRFELESIKSMLFGRSELDDYRVEPGDVLICEGGHGIARSAVWNGQIPSVMFQKALHRVRPLTCLNGYFLTFCLWVYERNEILQRYYTGAGIPHFTGKSLAKVSFPLPPLAEQCRIVAKVDQLMALVDELETQIAASRATAEKLMEALVAELSTPLLARDHHASALIEGRLTGIGAVA